ncbi:MAG: CYTH domain-containing protein, partial [Myxococcota bacterium]
MSTTSSLEREIKLGVPDGFRLPDLSDLAPGVTVSPVETAAHTAVYYDTADLRLARWDCGLRYRSNDGWTLKLGDVGSGPAVERREFLLTGDPGGPPASARDLVQAFCRGAPLEPVVLLRTERRRLTIRGRAGEPLAELTDDRVTADAGHVPA